jgi:cobalt-zinc-cadmium efflux system membrane fusion protein
MNRSRLETMLAAAVFAAGLFLGCSRPASEPSGGKTTPTADAQGHEHGAWWCAAHGVPEEECSRCNSKVAADLQKKGDWCKEHNRADSQCFVCHPELEAKFAARYEAKYGKQPPKPEGGETPAKN